MWGVGKGGKKKRKGKGEALETVPDNFFTFVARAAQPPRDEALRKVVARAREGGGKEGEREGVGENPRVAAAEEVLF